MTIQFANFLPVPFPLDNWKDHRMRMSSDVIADIEREASGSSRETAEMLNGRLLRIIILCREARLLLSRDQDDPK
jgi:hypothetical protein